MPKPRPPRPHSSRLCRSLGAPPPGGEEAADGDDDEEEDDDAELDAVDAGAGGQRRCGAHGCSPRARVIDEVRARQVNTGVMNTHSSWYQ